MIDLTKIAANKVSTEPSSYSLLLYGPSKIGKTTFVNELFPRVLNIMTERRYGALDGAMVQYISTWGEFKQVLSQLKRKEVQEMYDAVSIDTVENLYRYAGKFTASQFDEFSVGDGDVGYGRDHTRLSEVWFRGLKELESLPYTNIFVSHSTEKIVKMPYIDSNEMNAIPDAVLSQSNDGKQMVEFTKISPDLKEKGLSPVTKMVDNILYAENNLVNGEEHRILHLRGTLQYEAGTTFKGVKPIIPFSAEAYKQEVARVLGSKYEKTTEKKVLHADAKDVQYDFSELLDKTKDVAILFQKNNDIKTLTTIVEKTLGKGHKVNELSDNRSEDLAIILSELTETAEKKGY